MKKALIAVTAAVVLAGGSLAFAQTSGGGSGRGLRAGMMGGSGGYGPGSGMMGGYGPGSGAGYGSGTGMGSGGMGGYGSGPGGYGAPGTGNSPRWQGNAPFTPSTSGPLTRDQARSLVQSRISRSGNPNLKIGKVTEKNGEYIVNVVTKDNSLVERIHVDKSTGALDRSLN